MIQIYGKSTTSFTRNGRALHEALSSYVDEELNGKHEAELLYPLDVAGKWKELTEGSLLKVDGQVYRIYNKKKALEGIFVNARHLFYDNLDNFLEDVRPENLAGVAAGQWTMARTQYPHLFTVSGTLGGSATRYFIRKNVVEAFMGDTGILNTWGGEIEHDNYNIILHGTRGLDRGVLISYGKNILGIEETLNLDDVCTRMMPIGKDGLLLPEKYIDSPLIGNYPYPKIKPKEFDAETVEDLRAQAQALMDNGKIDIPKVNYKVDFIELSKTEEYKNYAVLERIYLGDTVTINHSKLGFDLKARVIKIRKNTLTGRNESLELGYFLPNIASSYNDVGNALINIAELMKSDKTALQQAIDDATELLTTALGGYVVKRNGEILIMDTENPATATRVWRWNINGLGYCSTYPDPGAINGPYGLAITMEGKINASFIYALSLSAISANLGTVTSGLIRSADGTVEINLNDTTGLKVYDDQVLVGSLTSEAGAVFPILQSEKVTSLDLINTINESVTLNVGSGQTYSSVSQAINSAFGPNKRILRNNSVITIRIHGTVNENVILEGFQGNGGIDVHLQSGAKLRGYFMARNNTVGIQLHGYNSGSWSAIDAPEGIPIYNDGSAYLDIYYLNVKGAGVDHGILGEHAGRTKIQECDISGVVNCIVSSLGHDIRSLTTKGNGSYIGALAIGGGVLYITGSYPVGGSYGYGTGGGFIHGDAIGTATASSYNVPPVTSQQFIQTFNPTSLYTVNHDTTSVDSYYPNQAAQGRWSGMSYWKDGVIKFGADVANFFAGGTGTVVEIRVRRRNSTHGTSSGVVPTAYGWTPGSAFNALTRGAWSNWVTVPAALFTGSGATLKFYNGTLNSGYAILDAAEVRVTTTKNI